MSNKPMKILAGGAPDRVAPKRVGRGVVVRAPIHNGAKEAPGRRRDAMLGRQPREPRNVFKVLAARAA
jgi:hypothetical protein